MPPVDVLIVGGGPGGLSAAHAILAARPGSKVAVMERSDLRPRGATFGMAPNGVRALEAIRPELKAAIAAHHTTHLSNRRFDPEGNELPSVSAQGVERIREHGELINLPWHCLQRELADALPEGTVHTHHRFLGYNEQADAGPDGEGLVVAEFETPEGVRRLEARLLVGCDGGQSAVREAMLGDGPPKFLGMAIWRAVRPVPADWPHSYAVFGRIGQTVVTSVLNGGTKITWQAFAPWPAERLQEIGGGRRAYIQELAAEGGAASQEEAGRARLQRALAAFEGYPPAVLDLMATTDPTSVTEHGQFCREASTCQTYAKGRVALAGDAAHLATPFLGQGCSQALEDALELGRAIGQHGPTPLALQAYQAVRLPLASAVQEESVQLCQEFASGKMDRTEFDVNVEKGFVQRRFEPLVPAVGVSG